MDEQEYNAFTIGLMLMMHSFGRSDFMYWLVDQDGDAEDLLPAIMSPAKYKQYMKQANDEWPPDEISDATEDAFFAVFNEKFEV